jgi:hypothetical protein
MSRLVLRKITISKILNCFLIGCFTIGLLATTLGCGRDNKIYPDLSSSPTPETGITPDITADGRSVLPPGFFNQSVNQALVDRALNNENLLSSVLRLQTFAGSNPPGGFFGDGTGNRAILGIAGHANTPLFQLGAITVDARKVQGSQNLQLSLIVDLECDGSAPRILQSNLQLSSQSAIANGYSRWMADVSTTSWQVVGASLSDPLNSNNLLLSSDSSENRETLDSLLVAFPDACLQNSSSIAAFAHNLPRGIPTASVLLTLGNDTTTDLNITLIKRISIGSVIHQGWE